MGIWHSELGVEPFTPVNSHPDVMDGILGGIVPDQVVEEIAAPVYDTIRDAILTCSKVD